VAYVEKRRPVAQSHVAHRQGCDLTLPVVLSGDAQSVRPSIVCIELQAVPRPLPEIDLESVVIGVPLRNQLAKYKPSADRIRIRLKEIDGISRTRNVDADVVRTRTKSGASNHVAEELSISRDRSSKSPSLPRLQEIHKCVVCELARVVGKRRIHDRQWNHAWRSRVVCECSPTIQ